jgi:lipoprotein-anchoring transpeptidase ErfK/SrfK
VLFLGLAFEVNTTVQAQQTSGSASDETGTTLEDIVNQYSPLLDQARADRDWPRVIAILEELHRIEPDSRHIQEQLAQAYLKNGQTLRHKGFVEEALAEFKQVLTLIPQQIQARQEIQMAEDYLTGIQHYQTGHWLEAITALEAVQAKEPTYTNVKDLLFSAYYNHGLALQAADELTPAREAFEAAIVLRPDLNEPYKQIAEIEFALAPQTPLVTLTPKPSNDRIIVVGIAEQRMKVYEGGELVFDFVVSTGEPGRDTAVGEFEILDKIDVAYASTWNLDMPYWMGIYWSGPLENGIHALPIVKHTGYKLWDGYLGQRVSYGCIILSDEDAATLFNWAEIGTKVKIVSGLAHWTPPE